MNRKQAAGQRLLAALFFVQEVTGHCDIHDVDCDLQLRCNALISLGLKAAQFTAKYLKHSVKCQTLNHRVPGSSPGAPTKLFKVLA
jgi:hypothetical protein